MDVGRLVLRSRCSDKILTIRFFLAFQGPVLEHSRPVQSLHEPAESRRSRRRLHTERADPAAETSRTEGEDHREAELQ